MASVNVLSEEFINEFSQNVLSVDLGGYRDLMHFVCDKINEEIYRCQEANILTKSFYLAPIEKTTYLRVFKAKQFGHLDVEWFTCELTREKVGDYMRYVNQIFVAFKLNKK